MHRSARQLGWRPLPWSEVSRQIMEHRQLRGLSTSDTLLRCTIVYDGEGIREVRTTPYSIRPITHLCPMEVPSSFDYTLKYADRSIFEPYTGRCSAGQEPLLIRDGLITDTTYTNVVLQMPDGSMLTPETPLLAGTRRAQLIEEGRIVEAPLGLRELKACLSVHLINAMMSLHDLEIPNRGNR